MQDNEVTEIERHHVRYSTDPIIIYITFIISSQEYSMQRRPLIIQSSAPINYSITILPYLLLLRRYEFYLNVSLKIEEIDPLPIRSIQGQNIPSFAHLSATT